MATRTGGRDKGWSTEELELMLTVVKEQLPLRANEWESVQLSYARRVGVLSTNYDVRSAEAIKRKFMTLKNQRKPTGDPTCPPEVVRAKRIYRDIESRGGVIALDDAPLDLVEGETSPQESVRRDPVAEDTATRPAALSTLVDESMTPPTRSAMSPAALTNLSDRLQQGGGGASVVLSQSAQPRCRLDRMIDQFEASPAPTDLYGIFALMEERSSAREMAYRRERDELEARREEQRRQDRIEREEKEARHEQVTFALLAKLIGKESSV